MVTLSGPCDWPYEACEACSTDVTAAHQSIATAIMWRLTHGRFGPCEVTVRPCADASVSCARCGGQSVGGRRCSCYSVPELVLPGPVTSVTEVRVDGTALAETAYRVDDHAWLVRVDGGVWPFCQDLAADIDEAGAFSVTYEIGFAPPAGAGEMTGELACDIARALCDDKKCRLPKRVQQKVRQGVTVTFEDLTSGKTGIEVVDLWLDAVNQKKKRSRVYSPDIPHVRQTTWPNDNGESA